MLGPHHTISLCLKGTWNATHEKANLYYWALFSKTDIDVKLSLNFAGSYSFKPCLAPSSVSAERDVMWSVGWLRPIDLN